MTSTVYNSDCLEAMRQMPDKAFDLAIVDPPYGIGDWTGKTGSKERNVTVSRFGGTVDWNDAIPSEDYFAELKRVSKEQIIWGANYYNSFPANGAAIVWYKHTKHPNYSDCEIASYSAGVRVAYISLEWYSLNRSEATFHPCQKPVALYKWLLTNYAKPGDTILDTHLGSGSSRIAAYDLGFDFTAYELDKNYFDAQEKRFQDHIAQPKLFAPTPIVMTQEAMFV